MVLFLSSVSVTSASAKLFSKCASSSPSFNAFRRTFHASSIFWEKLNVTGLAGKVDLHGKNVLVRVDLNVPLAKDDVTVTDDTRLRAIVPTTKFLIDKGANVILMSHFGRPKGEIIETGKNGRLNPVVKPLEELLGTHITKVDTTIGPEAEEAAGKLKNGDVLLLENTRFDAGETKNDLQLAEGMGKLADYFVMDAFGTAHRAHSSTAGITQFVKESAAGFLLDKELKYLQGAVDDPKKPMMAIVGGAKVSTKIPVIESLLEKCDTILVGGGMIFTFYKALGYEIGGSLIEEDMVELSASLMKKAEETGVKMILPSDVVVADKFDNDANIAIAKVSEGITGDWMGLDIGPDSLQEFKDEIEKCNTIVWNGPMGVFEMSNFAEGTNAVAQMLADATERGAITIVGGGDSVAAVNLARLGDKVSHISTGGGASLELLEGKTLPGVAALSDS